MPAKDLYHNVVKNALIKDGWRITHDPLRLKWGIKDMYVDLGAERILSAEKAGQKIAVEVKSFVGASDMNDLENALGQYLVYRSVIARTEPDRKLYLAITQSVFSELLSEPLGQIIRADYQVFLIVFAEKNEEIVQWET
ncbi:MAG: XisH family protein [Microcoleus sp. PH2017_29_MFU_D_A]|uniref:XisH family protein n=1 Tax=unclassified Microcoleus TaxID=2642155 RepID=UPI001DBC30F7|nr:MULTISPECIES: XisH family protein [unclassified Microcoleus]MCC3420471.1 XisH family protein [Microcoleus sp. PH2017_07_MST_O_A]MCC3513172.1 XisH family protein [Microcoleus sp. PH2017_17_BER_D_A]TAE54825.1 MAG: fatty-acid synthase [Oscillatoriales cyanobacterium]MCC3425374.1 XisH family protein [Microcoleus sp. PH2017_01_SCD_O_A]MCC3456599.1 XisH family protein [Microcoleus sp. PH2017_08_TRC_O_A]